MSTTSILIVDDHPIYRDALTEKLTTDFSPRGISLMGVSCLADAQSVISKGNNNWLVVLDLKLPDSDPIDNIKTLKSLNQVSYLVVISGLDEDIWEFNCINAGADIFISKNNTSDFIYSKLCELLHIRDYRVNPDHAVNMTKRQQDVLNCMSVGTSNKLIANQLGISEQTVKIHVSAIFRTLNVSNRTQAVYKAKTLRLV